MKEILRGLSIRGHFQVVLVYLLTKIRFFYFLFFSN
jgi:hypothetical protein